MNFIPAIETQPRTIIKQFQEQKMADTLSYLASCSSFYRTLFEKNHIDIRKIVNLEDLRYIPFTDKTDLQQFNDDFICVSKEKIIDYITTSGTLGDPVTFVMTDADLNRLAYNEKISFQCAGDRKSVV